MVVLTELVRSEDRSGPFVLYVYGFNGYHSGKRYFRRKGEPMKYPDEEIALTAAYEQTKLAMAEGREVRVCDPGDALVFHSDGQTVLHGANFWKAVGAE